MPGQDGTGPYGTYKKCMPTGNNAINLPGFGGRRGCFGRRCRRGYPVISEEERLKPLNFRKKNMNKAGSE